MSQVHKLLLVATTFTNKFTEEDLVVKAWQYHPELFGMKNYNYPDTNKVRSIICKSLVAKDLLFRVSPNTYRVNKTNSLIKKILGGNNGNESQEVDIPKHLLPLYHSDAYVKFKNELLREVTFTEAFHFWGLKKYTDDEGKIDYLTRELNKHSDNMLVRQLKHLHEHLLNKFDKHVKVLQKGTNS